MKRPARSTRVNIGSSAIVGLSVMGALSACVGDTSAPIVECVLEYGGESKTTVVHPTQDPYRVLPINVEDAFEFKAVYVTKPVTSAVLNLYTYRLSEHGPLLVEQTKYLPPFPRNDSGSNRGGTFTGRHYVYSPDGEELSYSCGWRAP